MTSTTKDNSCHIDRHVDYQGSRPPVALQAGIEKLVTGPRSAVAHQADEWSIASGTPNKRTTLPPLEHGNSSLNSGVTMSEIDENENEKRIIYERLKDIIKKASPSIIEDLMKENESNDPVMRSILNVLNSPAQTANRSSSTNNTKNNRNTKPKDDRNPLYLLIW